MPFVHRLSVMDRTAETRDSSVESSRLQHNGTGPRRFRTGKRDEGIMKRFWVVGGIYADTGFDRIAEGGKEERIGPFPDYAAAKAAWQKRAWETVDNANARFRIE